MCSCLLLLALVVTPFFNQSKIIRANVRVRVCALMRANEKHKQISTVEKVESPCVVLQRKHLSLLLSDQELSSRPFKVTQ